MLHLDLTLPTAEENLALDEALLEEAEASRRPREVLRIWEPRGVAVIVGRSSQVAREVSLDACRSRNVPILRRTSGGAAVVIGPGCLMYALVLSYQRRPELRAIDQAHRVVLGTMAGALRTLVHGLNCRGTSDLAVGEFKVSGNSVRCKREHLLYHGTLLYQFPLELIDALLAMPPREPEYRAGRPHGAFVRNLSIDVDGLHHAFVQAWQADEALASWPEELTRRLVREKYSRREWNERP
jgi:lipoate-protein ligase A